MTTIVKLGFGIIKIGVKGVKLFVDTIEGKAPDMRIDEGEISGPNSETHVHFGDGEGSPVGDGLEFLLGVANTNYFNSKNNLLCKRDYIFSDEYTLNHSFKYRKCSLK